MRTKENKLKLSPLEQKYLELSEVYLAKYESQIERQYKMMAAKGVIVEMESDLAFYHIKSPRTEKSTQQLDRLNILRSVIDEFAGIHCLNWQVNQVLGRFYRENQELKSEVESLKEKLKFLVPSDEVE